MQRIESAQLTLPVIGLNLTGATFGAHLRGPGTLVVFLRHLGCMFCREMVSDLRSHAAGAGFPPVLLVAQSPAAVCVDFFADRWPAAVVIADPDRVLYTAFDIPRATVGRLLGPPMWSCAIRANVKGHRQQWSHTLHPLHGDPWLLSAMYLASFDGTVAWFHRARYAGDRPDYTLIPRG